MSRFGELNDLVLQLKGLVLVRELQEKRGADAGELGMYDAEIERVRDRLAEFVREGGGAERVALPPRRRWDGRHRLDRAAAPAFGP
jgi:hypothetical protein